MGYGGTYNHLLQFYLSECLSPILREKYNKHRDRVRDWAYHWVCIDQLTYKSILFVAELILCRYLAMYNLCQANR